MEIIANTNVNVFVYGLQARDIGRGLVIRRNGGGITFSNIWISGAHDSCISRQSAGRLKIDGSLIEECGTLFSTENKKGNISQKSTLILTNNLIGRLQHHDFDRTALGMEGVEVILKNNVFFVGSPDDITASQIFGIAFDNIVECEDNIIIWPFVEDWANIPNECIKLTRDQEIWKEFRKKWIANRDDLVNNALDDNGTLSVTTPTMVASPLTVVEISNAADSGEQASRATKGETRAPGVSDRGLATSEGIGGSGSGSWWSDGTNWFP